jgi:Domain of unknown function (DUF2017)
MGRKGPVERTRRGYALDLEGGERDVLRGLPAQLRELLEEQSPSSDPAMARLYPPAYPDDPLRNLEFEMVEGDELTKQRLSAIETMERTVDARRLSEDELLAWVAVMNDLRLVLGTRLDITEGTRERDFPADDPRRSAFVLYGYLTYLVDASVGALAGNTEIGSPPPEDPEPV